MRQIRFVTPTRLSLLDITTMGDSSKRGDETTIGTFDSGLKYAIALLLRNEVSMHIQVTGNSVDREEWKEPYTEEYEFSTFTDSDHKRDKELIQIDCSHIFHGGSALNQFCMQEPTAPEHWTVKTAFAKNLGHNWELWMALREIYSNMLDERGYYSEEDIKVEEGTIITLLFEESSEFNTIWNERSKYVLENTETFTDIGRGVQVFDSPDNTLRIFKSNILVYEDAKVPSRFNFNINFGEIDERRILRDLWTVGNRIKDAIRYTNNETFLRTIITSDFKIQEDEFLKNGSCYGDASDLIHTIAYEVEKEFGEVNSYSWVMELIKSRDDCKIAGKIIKSVGDSLWAYNREVIVVSPAINQQTSLKQQIEELYNFDVDVEIKETELSGSTVIADKFENCLIVSPNFNLESDFHTFIVQYLVLTEEDNIIDALSKYIQKLIKKQNYE